MTANGIVECSVARRHARRLDHLRARFEPPGMLSGPNLARMARFINLRFAKVYSTRSSGLGVPLPLLEQPSPDILAIQMYGELIYRTHS